MFPYGDCGYMRGELVPCKEVNLEMWVDGGDGEAWEELSNMLARNRGEGNVSEEMRALFERLGA